MCCGVSGCGGSEVPGSGSRGPCWPFMVLEVTKALLKLFCSLG